MQRGSKKLLMVVCLTVAFAAVSTLMAEPQASPGQPP